MNRTKNILIKLGQIDRRYIFLLIGLSVPLYSQLKTTLPNNDDVHHVRVIAQQFAWNIHYPGPDGKFGKTNIDLVDEELKVIWWTENMDESETIIMNICTQEANRCKMFDSKTKHSYNRRLY